VPFPPPELIAAVYDNLRNLGVEVLDVANLRLMFGVLQPRPRARSPNRLLMLAGLCCGAQSAIGLEQRHPARQVAVRRAASSTSSASRTSSTSRIAKTMRWIDALVAAGTAYVLYFSARRVQPARSDSARLAAAERARRSMQVALA
jgi:hypothetical protein